ncbi:MAG: hypothetical protein HC884_08080, partial [Chloroflexaceae bacterium]|nr:hypothetical protein [Chloroflexaceae bacterium]
MTTFFRLLHHDDKATALAAATAALRQGTPHPDTHTVDPASFAQVPGSPFAYWVSERVRRLFAELPRFESKDRHACVTNPAGNDHRYFRTSWEIPAKFKGRATKWVNMLKGGDFSRYYSDTHLFVDWDDKEQTFLGFEGTPHRPLKRLASADYFFLPGITYSTRSQVGFSARILPAGCIFHAKGPGIFCGTENNPRFLALMNSQIFHDLLLLQMTFGSYEVGVIQRTPVPNLDTPDGEQLGKLAFACVNLKRGLDTATETSHVFQLPALLQASGDTLAARDAAWAQRVAAA